LHVNSQTHFQLTSQSFFIYKLNGLLLDAVPCIASTIKTATLGVKKRRFSAAHFRKNSLPDAEIRSITSPQEICVNGPHIYSGFCKISFCLTSMLLRIDL